MGQVDVTELLGDPDFVDFMSIVHRTARVSDLGSNILTEEIVQTIGSVQPVSGKNLQRLPETLRVLDIRSFWVRGEIKSDGTCAYPDILIFKGQRYAVQQVLDWMNFGQGWCEGLAIREKPTV